MVKNDAELARIVLYGHGPDEQMDVKAVFSIEVCFGDMGISLDKLYEVRNAVVGVINQIAKSFGYKAPTP